MMLRRRVEREAKLVAKVLFKEMANVRDWNSDSQSISVKRAKRVSKSIAAMQAEVMRSRPEVPVACSDALHLNSFMTMNGKVSPGTVPRPADLRPSRKCKKRVDLSVCPLSVVSCVRKSVKQLSPKSKERKEDSRRSVKKEGVRICNKPLKQGVGKPQILGSLPGKHACKLEQNVGRKTGCRTPKMLSNSPKKYDVELSKRLSISVRIENGKIASACGIASKSEGAVLPPQKLVVSLGDDLVQSTRMIPQGLSTTLLADKFIVSRQLEDHCSVAGTTQLREYSNAGNAEIFPACDVSKNRFRDSRSSAMNSLPSHEKCNVELANNLFKSNAGKHKIDAFTFGEVCVKLTKLNERNFANGETKCSSEFQTPTNSSICNSAKYTESTFMWKKQKIANLTAGDSVAYPTGRMEDFLKVFELMKKSEIKKSDVTPNKLHREAGGKLRRFLKPRMMSEVVHRRSNAASFVSPNGNLTSRGKDSFSGTVNGASSRIKGKVKSNPTFPNTVDKIALLEKKLKENKQSPVVLARRLSVDYCLSEFENNKSYSISKSVILDLAPEAASRDRLVATDTTDDGDFVEQKKLPVDVHLAAVSKALASESDNQTLTDSICQSRKRTKTVPIVSMATAAQNPENSVHLLRANTDEYEKYHKWESNSENVKQNSSNYLPQESNSMLNELSKNAASLDGIAKSYHFSASDGVAETRETLRKGRKTANAPRLKNTLRLSNLTSLGCKVFTRACQLSLRKTDRKKTRKETSFKRLERLKVKTSLFEKKMAKQKDGGKLFTLAADDTGVDNPVDSKFDSYVLLTYWSKETDCIVPHMCSVCWVNDHMYCKNMKRTSNDLPAIGGCIHHIPCFHYMTAANQLSSGRTCHSEECHKLESVSATGDGELQQDLVRRHWNDRDLICREEMPLFDGELPSVLQKGTECFKVQSHGVCLAAEDSVVLEEVETGILPEEFGSEVIIENPDGDVFLELGLLEDNSCSAHRDVERQENETTEPADTRQNC